jgi:hypothetical protein
LDIGFFCECSAHAYLNKDVRITIIAADELRGGVETEIRVTLKEALVESYNDEDEG